MDKNMKTPKPNNDYFARKIECYLDTNKFIIHSTIQNSLFFYIYIEKSKYKGNESIK